MFRCRLVAVHPELPLPAAPTLELSDVSRIQLARAEVAMEIGDEPIPHAALLRTCASPAAAGRK
jgi:hypothetical protein